MHWVGPPPLQPCLSHPLCPRRTGFLCGSWCITKSAASTAWRTYKDVFSLWDTNHLLMTATLSTSMPKREGNGGEENESTCDKLQLLSARENIAAALLGTKWCNDVQILKKIGGHGVFFSSTHWQTLCMLTSHQRGRLREPTCHSVSFLFHRIPRPASFWNTFSHNDALRQKTYQPLSFTPVPPVSALQNRITACVALGSRTLNCSSHLQTKLKPAPLSFCRFKGKLGLRAQWDIKSF